jgi:uncharacterized protein DUF1569
MTNLFEPDGLQQSLERINKLTPTTTAQWGKMNVAQMLAHCNVAYDMVYTEKYPKAGAIKKFLLKTFVKPSVVGPKPYPKNSRTGPDFIIADERNFETEKNLLIDNLKKTQELGTAYFDNRESLSMGPLTAEEWNVSFSKHLDHHLTQFGV